MDKKQQLIACLYAFAAQRSGIEFVNYGDVKAFRSEQRSITKDGREARQLIREVELIDSITADDILQACARAYSGRLTIKTRDDGAIAIDYCTGQYFPTEYRRAVCAVMSSCLWDWMRDKCMPSPVYVMGDGVKFKTQQEARDYAEHFRREHNNIIAIEERYNGLSAGDWLRSKFRKQFGRGMASRWFN